MNVDPARAPAMRAAIPDEPGDVTVRAHARLMHLLVGGQKLCTASPAADEELSVNQLMPRHLIETEEPRELGRVGRPVSKEADPHGSVHQDH